MNYQEGIDILKIMTEQERQLAIQQHWQVVFSDGFIGFVQGEIEGLVVRLKELDETIAELPKSHVILAPLLKAHQQALSLEITSLLGVWTSMINVYERLQKLSEVQGNSQGMVAHGRHRTMPRGRSVSPATNCFRCGDTAVDLGLCSGCLATQQKWEQEDLEYDRQFYERQQNELEYQRLQDDQRYYNDLQDFNTYTNYYTDF
jgi:hypothetical protein